MSEGPQELSNMTEIKVQASVKILFFIFPSQNYAYVVSIILNIITAETPKPYSVAIKGY
jgi:hypothetical protein